jgi:CheY-like chemotaxis protein
MEKAALTVLIVDDDPLVLAATSRCLRRLGLRTLMADSPFGVSAIILKESPDAVVLDAHMPGLDGAHLVRLLRSSPRTAATPIVFHSGDPEDVLAKLAASFGATYACKAGGLDALYDAIIASVSPGAPAPRSPKLA